MPCMADDPSSPVCAALGELNEHNADSWVKLNKQDSDVTTNIRLQVIPDQTDEQLWSVMDNATFQAIAVMADTKSKNIEYWHNLKERHGSRWSSKKPVEAEIHVPGIVHECSTLYMGPPTDNHAAVDEKYTPYGCRNVYVTGGAIFPSAGTPLC